MISRLPLQRTRQLVQSHLPSSSQWLETIDNAALPRQKSLGVYGSNASGWRQLVTVLLEDPLTQTESTTKALHARASEQVGHSFTIKFGQVQRDLNSLKVDSPWLRETGLDIQEITTRDPSIALSNLLNTDITLLILDPVLLLDSPEIKSILPDLIGKPNLYLVINGDSSSHTSDAYPDLNQWRSQTTDRIKSQLKTIQATSRTDSTSTPGITFLSTDKAFSAMQSLRQTLEPGTESKETAFERFKNDFLASQLGQLRSDLVVQSRAVAERQEESSRWVVRAALGRIKREFERMIEEADEMRSLLQIHSDSLTRTREEVRGKSFTNEGMIKEEMESVKRGVQHVLNTRLRWWQVLTWRVDMVSEEVGREVEQRWAVELGQKLAFEAGRLSAIQNNLNTKLYDFLNLFSPQTSSTPHPYYSPLLLNHLRRLEFESPIHSHSLLRPITTRRNQLLQHVIPQLQSKAHTMTFTTLSTSFLSSSLAWTATVPLDLINAETGLGVGLLATLGCVRWGVGAWARAQRLFWADWARVEEGLASDLEVALEGDLGKVEKVGLAGILGVEEMVNVRMDKVAQGVATVKSIEKEVAMDADGC